VPLRLLVVWEPIVDLCVGEGGVIEGKQDGSQRVTSRLVTPYVAAFHKGVSCVTSQFLFQRRNPRSQGEHVRKGGLRRNTIRSHPSVGGTSF
jgi:hypothetical protein